MRSDGIGALDQLPDTTSGGIGDQDNDALILVSEVQVPPCKKA
jgi:hypothetical protein